MSQPPFFAFDTIYCKKIVDNIQDILYNECARIKNRARFGLKKIFLLHRKLRQQLLVTTKFTL